MSDPTPHSQFKNLKKRKPLWKEISSLVLLVVGLWGGLNGFMNYSAYSQIFAFQYKSVKASTIQDIATEQKKISKEKINKSEKKKTNILAVAKIETPKNNTEKKITLRKRSKRPNLKTPVQKKIIPPQVFQKNPQMGMVKKRSEQNKNLLAWVKKREKKSEIFSKNLQARSFERPKEKTDLEKKTVIKASPEALFPVPEKALKILTEGTKISVDKVPEEDETTQKKQTPEGEEQKAVEKITPKEEAESEKKAPVVFREAGLSENNQAQKTLEKMDIYPSDNRLIIPSIGKNVPLIMVPNHKNWRQLETNIQKGLQDGVVVHPVSRNPGNFGNFFLTGHSSYYAWDKGRFKDVFALLHEMEVGDMAEIYWEGKKYRYRINQKEVVAPTAVEILNQPKDEKKLTLMTCTPIGSNESRLILVGELIE